MLPNNLYSLHYVTIFVVNELLYSNTSTVTCSTTLPLNCHNFHIRVNFSKLSAHFLLH